MARPWPQSPTRPTCGDVWPALVPTTIACVTPADNDQLKCKHILRAEDEGGPAFEEVSVGAYGTFDMIFGAISRADPTLCTTLHAVW